MKEHGLKPYYYMISPGNFKAMFKSYSGLGEEVGEVLDLAKEQFGSEQKEEGLEDVDLEGNIVEYDMKDYK